MRDVRRCAPGIGLTLLVLVGCGSSGGMSDGGGGGRADAAAGHGGTQSGAAGARAGASGSAAGSGGSLGGAAGYAAGASGSTAGASGSTAGAGGSTAGASGSVAGAGGSGGGGGPGGVAGATAGAAGGPAAGGAGGGPPAVCTPPCGAHQRCIFAGGGPTCACAPGYEKSADACVWGTVPADPGFQNMPAGAWTTKPGSTLDPTATGSVDPGELTISAAATYCSAARGVSQTITMPALAEAEPFALDFISNVDCNAKLGPACWALDMAVNFNGAAIIFENSSGTRCLGERAYGGSFDLQIAPVNQYSCATRYTDAVIDHVQIVAAPSCPRPGTLPDGNFDATPSTWKTGTDPQSGMPGTSEIAAGVGTAGSAALHMFTAIPCGLASAGESISPPLSMPSAAIQFRFKGSAGSSTRVGLGYDTLAVVRGTGAWAVANVCLLEADKGMTQGLGFTLYDPNCGPLQDVLIDDVKFVSDPSCAATAYLQDGGFERTDPGVAWDAAGSDSEVAVETSPANVHSGNRALKMISAYRCSTSPGVKFPAAIPSSAAGAGPALEFFYKAPVLAHTDVSVTAGNGSTGKLPAVPSYTRVQICIDPATAGQTLDVNLMVTGNLDGVCTATSVENAWFDDFAMVTSSACPAE